MVKGVALKIELVHHWTSNLSKNMIISNYQEQQVPEVAERFMREIIAQAEELPTYPDRGRTVAEFNQPSLRELIHPPFRIVYRRDEQRIAIVRIWRSERLMKLP